MGLSLAIIGHEGYVLPPLPEAVLSVNANCREAQVGRALLNSGPACWLLIALGWPLWEQAAGQEAGLWYDPEGFIFRGSAFQICTFNLLY